MKFISYVLVFFTFSLGIFNKVKAQNPVIAILPFKYNANAKLQSDAAAMVTDRIMDRFISTGQAKVVEREFFKDLQNEKFLTSEIDFIDGPVINKTKSVGANYIMTGKISSLILNHDKDSYLCNLSVALRVIDVETGEILGSYSMDSAKPINASNSAKSILGGLGGIIAGEVLRQTEGDAIKAAVNNLKDDIAFYANKHFPIEVEIKAISLLTKDQKKAQEIEIRVGEVKGAKKKTKYTIKEKYQDDGDTLYKEVGEVEITEVIGKHLSTAKVTKGGDKIKEKIEAGAQLVAIEYYKTK